MEQCATFEWSHLQVFLLLIYAIDIELWFWSKSLRSSNYEEIIPIAELWANFTEIDVRRKFHGKGIAGRAIQQGSKLGFWVFFFGELSPRKNLGLQLPPSLEAAFGRANFAWLCVLFNYVNNICQMHKLCDVMHASFMLCFLHMLIASRIGFVMPWMSSSCFVSCTWRLWVASDLWCNGCLLHALPYANDDCEWHRLCNIMHVFFMFCPMQTRIESRIGLGLVCPMDSFLQWYLELCQLNLLGGRARAGSPKFFQGESSKKKKKKKKKNPKS